MWTSWSLALAHTAELQCHSFNFHSHLGACVHLQSFSEIQFLVSISLMIHSKRLHGNRSCADVLSGLLPGIAQTGIGSFLFSRQIVVGQS